MSHFSNFNKNNTELPEVTAPNSIPSCLRVTKHELSHAFPLSSVKLCASVALCEKFFTKTFLPFSLFPLILLALLLSACTHLIAPQSGGGTLATFGGTTSPSSFTLTAPENATRASTTTASKTITRTLTLPAPLPATPPAPGEPSPGPAAPLPTPIPLTETITETVTTTTGTSHISTAPELAVKFGALEPLLWVGIALIVLGAVAAAALFYLGWPTPALLAGLGGIGGGAGMIILFEYLPQINPYFALAALALLLPIPFIFYAHKKGGLAALEAAFAPAPSA